MLVTLSGMVISVILQLPSNAYSPMVATLLGITVFMHPTIRVLDFVSMMALQLPRES